MDFVRPPYKTIEDDAREQREALERKVADRDALIADKDAENASLIARIKELEAALAAKNG